MYMYITPRTCSALARVASLVVLHEAVFTREHAHGAAGAWISHQVSCNYNTTSTLEISALTATNAVYEAGS